MYRLILCCPLLLLCVLVGCKTESTSSASSVPAPAAGDSTVLISVTSDAADAPQAVDMAMKLAGFSLDEDREVAMFFNVKGVRVPTAQLDDALAFGENDPIKAQLTSLITRGAEIHVCPICMEALDVKEADLIEGAEVTTRPKLFAHIGADTAVFTY